MFLLFNANVVPSPEVGPRAVQLYSHYVQPVSSGLPKSVFACPCRLRSVASALSSAPADPEPPPAAAAASPPTSVFSTGEWVYVMCCMNKSCEFQLTWIWASRWLFSASFLSSWVCSRLRVDSSTFESPPVVLRWSCDNSNIMYPKIQPFLYEVSHRFSIKFAF